MNEEFNNRLKKLCSFTRWFCIVVSILVISNLIISLSLKEDIQVSLILFIPLGVIIYSHILICKKSKMKDIN